MINKKIAAIGMGIFVSQASLAGAMGPASTTTKQLTPFVGAEATVNWSAIEGATLYGIPPKQTRQHWGGRLSAGLLFPFKPQWQLSSEIGWGYYGSHKTDVTASAYNNLVSGDSSEVHLINRSHLYGFDILVGALYGYKNVDVFAKVGAMLENRHYSYDFGSSRTFLSIHRTSSINTSNTITNVYPEIKVGGIYNINPMLGLTLAYMHVFGNGSVQSTLSGTTRTDASGSMVASTSLQAPTIDSLLFGLSYKLD